MTTLTFDKSISELIRADNRPATIDWLNDARILAALMILVGHVSANALYWTNSFGSANWWIANFYHSTVVWCVQIFVMMSGILLLDPRKNESMMDFYKKRASKLLVPVAFWSLFYMGWIYFSRNVVNGAPVSIGFLFKSFLLGSTYYHMWFFYMIVGLYIFTPFLRKVVRQSSRKELLYLCVFLFAFAIIAKVIHSYYANPIFPTIFWSVFYLPYFLAGYLIYVSDIKLSNVSIFAIILSSIVLTGLGHYFVEVHGNQFQWKNYFYSGLSVNWVAMSLGVMLLLKKYSATIFSTKIRNYLLPVTLGICLIHPVFINIMRWVGLKSESYTLFTVPLVSILLIVVSVLACRLILKIPLLKKVI